MVLAKNFRPSEAQLEVLNRGLTFVPTLDLDRGQSVQLQMDLQTYHRRLRLAAYYKSGGTQEPVPFLPQSDWTPTLDKLPREVRLLEEKDMRDFGRRVRTQRDRPNLSEGEVTALKELANNKKIVIKKADKGSVVVVLGRDQYVSEARRQLDNQTYYRKLDKPIFPETIPMVHNIIDGLHRDKFLTKKQKQFLKGEVQPRQRLFYILPKIHKDPEGWIPPFEVPPGRPIVSDCSSETSRTAEYIDYFLNPLSTKHNSYIKDTYHFIGIVKTLRVPPDSLFFTIDIDSLYTNIDTGAGLEAVRKIFRDYPDARRPDDGLLQLLEINLTRNDFAFDSQNYLQIKGTAMGKKFAPAYANIFMANWEKEALAKCPKKPLHYFRYLDDIWGVWGGSEGEFDQFIQILDSHDPSIRLKFKKDKFSLEFLDTTVYKGPSYQVDQRLDIKVYFKDTDTHALLFKTSLHPKHTFRGIVKSQLLRFDRICTQVSEFWVAARVLFRALLKRGYGRSFLRRCLKSFRREKVAGDKRLIPFVTTFCSINCHMARVIKSNYATIMEQSGLLPDFRVMAAYRRHKNLGNYLVRAKLPPIQTFGARSEPPYFRRLNYIRNRDNTVFQIKQKFDPMTVNCIYVLFCATCGIQYVGETKNSISARVGQHKFTVVRRMGPVTPLIQHFRLHGWDAARVAGIQSNSTWTDSERRTAERRWIFLLKTLEPTGLNKK